MVGGVGPCVVVTVDINADVFLFFLARRIHNQREAVGGANQFFFSSRRRHTRCSRDWSSDVCSSDLSAGGSRGGTRPRCSRSHMSLLFSAQWLPLPGT